MTIVQNSVYSKNGIFNPQRAGLPDRTIDRLDAGQRRGYRLDAAVEYLWWRPGQREGRRVATALARWAPRHSLYAQQGRERDLRACARLARRSGDHEAISRTYHGGVARPRAYRPAPTAC